MPPIHKKLTTVLAVACISALSTSQAEVAAGSFDPAFGTAGRVAIDFENTPDYGDALALQSDGKMVIAGTMVKGVEDRFAVARYEADGTPDLSFGQSGERVLEFGTNSSNATCVAVQTDGKIVVGGRIFNRTLSQMVVARFTARGELDTTFNNVGYVTTSISEAQDSVRSVALQADGKIVTTGYVRNGTGFSVAVVRYLEDGSLDSTFADGGISTISLGTGRDLAIQKDGRIVVAGNSSSMGFALFRYNSNGSLDTSFNGSGSALINLGGKDQQGNAVSLLPDGKILVGGQSNGDLALLRYDLNGTLDTSFNGVGYVTTDVAVGEAALNDIDVNADGKITAVGYVSTANGRDQLLACYNPDGTLDTAFNGTGILQTKFSVGPDYGNGIAWQNDGKIVAFGSSVFETSDMLLARYAGPEEIAVQRQGGIDLVDGVGTVQIGGALKNNRKFLTFTIINNGAADLTNIEVSIGGRAVRDFKLTGHKITSLAGKSRHSFKVHFRPNKVGLRKATLRIRSSDSDESSFDIAIEGKVREKRGGRGRR